MKKKIILVILMVLGMLIPSNVIKAEGNTVRILFTNNLRDSLETFRTIDENAKEKTIYGYATMANAIANLKDENTILLDTGDFSLGTIFGCLAEKNAVDLSMMKSFGYDAVLLGNEDFDLGVEGLSTMLSRVEEGPAILLTNNAGYDFQDGIYLDGLNADETKAYSIIEKAGKRIAILGVSERRNKEDKVFSNPQKALKKSLEEIKKENVNTIICLAHGDEAFAQEVAEKNKDIQIVIYSDGVAKDSYVDNTLLVSTNDYGETLGLIEIGDRNSVQHIAVSETYGENEEIVNQIQNYKKSVNDTILRRYGLSYKENYARADFNMVLPALEDKRSEVGYFIADAFKEAYVLREDDEVKDVIGIVDAEGITAPIMNGNLSINDIFRLSAKGKGEDDLVGTSLIRVYVKGSDLRNLCELDATLLSDEEHQKDKLYFGGMKYKYNDEGVAWNKVEEVYTSVTVDYYTIINDRRYYPVVMSERVYNKLNQYFQNEAKALSFHAYGLDQDPEPEMRTLIMRNNDGTIIKEWVAIAKYFSLFERDGSTYILSRNYENMAPRKEIDHSFNMLRFLRNVRRVAWERYFGYILMAIGGLVALKVIVWGINKMRNKQKAEK